MERNELRVLIKHYYLRAKASIEAEEKLDKYYDISAASITTVQRWIQEFNFSRTRTNDEPRSGRTSDTITAEMIERILRLA